MALLGAQLVITLVMVSLIQKLSPHFSLAKWLLCSTGLTRYLYPTDDELKTLAGVPKNINKHKKDSKASQREKSNTFHVPRNLDIQLDTIKISSLDVIHLRYYLEYQWLVDFSLYSALVYLISEVYNYFIPLKDEINLSMLWCFLVLFFSFKLLVSLTLIYFKSEESIGERSTCIVTGLSYLLIAMIVLIVDENTLELGLDQAYRSFNQSASVYLDNQGLSSTGPASKIVLKFFIAVLCGILGAIFTFPGLRMAKMHWDSLKFCTGNQMLKVVLNVSFVMPFLLVALWIKPISRDYLTARIFSGMEKPLMTVHAFETMRLVAVVVAVLLRFVLMPIHLQSYLNIAYQRIEDLKKEAGRITNIELQKNIASIFQYLCVVTLQYVAPILLCLYCTLMYKTLGGFAWTGFVRPPPSFEECSADLEPITSTADVNEAGDGDNSALFTSAYAVHMSLQSLKGIFSTEVFRGLFGFATWWSCFVWFAATSLGMVYQSYFSKL